MPGTIVKSVCSALLAAAAAPAQALVLYVGPEMPYDTPGKAAAVARDGDVVEIEAAVYDGDVAVWTQNDLVIRGIGGRPHLRAAGKAAEGKAIWVIKGNNTTVENVEFSGASVPDQNGAGIRLEGANLTVRNCYFHNNENGILTGENPDSEVVVEYSEFDSNGFGDGQSHNMYIGRIAAFTLRYSYSHHARVGHQVKSRAERNILTFNRLSDELSGTSSYLIDLPNPGQALIVGNELEQGTQAENWAMLHSAQSLQLINNTLVNDRSSGVFVKLTGDGSDSVMQNNLFVGNGTLDIGNAKKINNLHTDEPGFASRMSYDYRLTADSPAIDAGSEPAAAAVMPDKEYVHPVSSGERARRGPPDIGAHEYHPDL